MAANDGIEEFNPARMKVKKEPLDPAEEGVEMALNDSTEGFKLGNMRVKFKAKDGVDEQESDYEPTSPTGAESMPKSRKLQRPKRRHINRWDDDDHNNLLLAILTVVRRRKMNFPFDEVAAELGPPFTEKSIVQHLLKMKRNQAPAPVKLQRKAINERPNTKPRKDNKESAGQEVPAGRVGDNKMKRSAKPERTLVEESDAGTDSNDITSARKRRKSNRINVKRESSSE